ncbi:MAG: orotate phosphoribosyltransferase [Alphaproteobacteria bacterium]
MINVSNFISTKEIARLTAKMLLEIEAVHFRPNDPFVLTSGRKSPVYIDCRKIISFPRVRSTLMDFAAVEILRDVGFESLQGIAGGETAGIPFAAMVAERLALPMQYVRKQPKGFGRGARIEGDFKEGDHILLVEDLASEGSSKLNFINALRDAGAKADYTFVIFYYDIFKNALDELSENGIKMNWLATWWDVLAEAKLSGKFNKDELKQVEEFLHDPLAWRG